MQADVGKDSHASGSGSSMRIGPKARRAPGGRETVGGSCSWSPVLGAKWPEMRLQRWAWLGHEQPCQCVKDIELILKAALRCFKQGSSKIRFLFLEDLYGF